ncbi:MAG TPA: response regulator [Steroidobacteraceae bacterium]|jgi:HD-like signal output (HDOD) protein|nr:response regulator [Steroidobacteraceae bacterium]
MDTRSNSKPPVRHVLFVDDEPQVLDGLRTRLQPLMGKWQMTFVDSGADALSRFEKTPHDVIVSDISMPGMDGAQLLHAISERWPATIRIALSSVTDGEQKMRLLPLAHQTLSKPCRPEQLEDAVVRSLQLREELTHPGVQAVIGRIRQLPARPQVFAQLQVAMAKPNATARDVARVIARDTALTVKVLQIANSAFFRRARRISNIEQAVLYLGFQTVRNLVMCAEVFARWPGRMRHAAVDLEDLQMHAQRTAAVAQALTAGTQFADDAVLAALLHDIGYWVLIQEYPRELEQAIELALAADIALPQAENEILGASHAEIGAYLLAIWGLPYAVVEAVAHHHRPTRVKSAGWDALSALAVSMALTGGDDTDGCARNLLPSSNVGAEYLESLNSPLSWQEAASRARGCLERIAREAN